MTAEQADKPGAGDKAAAARQGPPVQPPAKPAKGDWAMTVNPVPPAQPADKPARGDWAMSVKQEPAATRKQPAQETPPAPLKPRVLSKPPAAAKPPAGHKPPVTHTPIARPKPAVPGTPSAAHKTPVKLHPVSGAALEGLKAPAPSPAKGKLVAAALCVMAGIAVCAFASSQRAKHKAAEQRTAQALSTVAGYVARIGQLKAQVPALQQQLDEPISELKPVIASPAADKAGPQRVESAIQAVAKVEKALLDAETGEEQALLALEALKQHADYPSLSEKVRAASTEYKGLQSGVEAKCQTVRSLIMSANSRVMRPGRDSK